MRCLARAAALKRPVCRLPGGGTVASSAPRCMASTTGGTTHVSIRAVPTTAAFANVPPVEPSKLDFKLDAALTALSAIGSQALAARSSVDVNSYAPDKSKSSAAAAVAAVDASGSLSQTASTPAYGGTQRVAAASIGMHAISVRRTLALFSWQLMRAALPTDFLEKLLAKGRQMTHEDTIAISKELNEAGKRKETIAILAVALCYIEGVGLFEKNRARAREMLEQLRVRIPTFGWPSLIHGLLLLAEVQERVPPAGPGLGPTDLAYAPAAFKSHADCVSAVSILEECWVKHKLAPAPFLLARLHLHGIGGDSLATRDVDMSLRWLCVGAAAGDPSCCVELARFLIWTRATLPGGVAGAEAAAAARAGSSLVDAAATAGAGAAAKAANATVYHLSSAPPGSAASPEAEGTALEAPGGGGSAAAPAASSAAVAGSARSPAASLARPQPSAASDGGAARPESLAEGVNRAIQSCLKYASVCGNLQAREWLQHEYRSAGLVKLAELWETGTGTGTGTGAGPSADAAAAAGGAVGSARAGAAAAAAPIAAADADPAANAAAAVAASTGVVSAADVPVAAERKVGPGGKIKDPKFGPGAQLGKMGSKRKA